MAKVLTYPERVCTQKKKKIKIKIIVIIIIIIIIIIFYLIIKNHSDMFVMIVCKIICPSLLRCCSVVGLLI